MVAAGWALGCNIADYELVDRTGTVAPPSCEADEAAVDDACHPVGMQPESCPWGALPDGTCDLGGAGADPARCVVVEAPDWFVSTRRVATALGTEAAPFPSIQAAVDASAAGDIIFVEAGAYPESVVIEGKSVHVVGECGALEGVVVDGSLLDAPALVVRGAETSGTVVSGLTLRGFVGMWAESAGSLTLLDVRTADTDGEGIHATSVDELTLDDLSIRNAGGAALQLAHVPKATIERATIERTRAIGPRGRGVELVDVAELLMRDVIVSDSPGTGLLLDRVDGTLERVAVTRAGIEGRYAAGIRARFFRGTMTGVLVTDASNVGIEIATSSDLQLSECAVLRSGVQAPPGEEAIDGITTGSGLRIVGDSAVDVTACTIAGARGAGVHVQGSVLKLGDSLVRDVAADDSGEFGDGVAVYPGGLSAFVETPGAEPRVVVERSVIDAVARAGLANFGSIVELESALVRCTGLGIVGEPFGGELAREQLPFGPSFIDEQGFWFVDHGGNLCGCDAIWDACGRRTPGLTPSALPGQLLPPQ